MISTKMEKIFKSHNGILTKKMAESEGVSGEELSKASERGDILEEHIGVYLLDERYIDDQYVLQLMFEEAIYSHESAAMFHDLTTFSPFKSHLTFDKDAIVRQSIQDEYIFEAHYAYLPEHHTVEMNSWFGNKIRVTSLERTVVDMISDRIYDDLNQEIMLSYLHQKNYNINELLKVATDMKQSQQIILYLKELTQLLEKTKMIR